MATFFDFPVTDFSLQPNKLTIATGPVIVNQKGDKILLHRSKSLGKWQFIGGRYTDDISFQENALKCAEEVILNNPITLDNKDPIVLFDTVDSRGYEEELLLVHYGATLEKEDEIGEAQWFDLDQVEILDAKNQTSSPNVRILAEKFLSQS